MRPSIAALPQKWRKDPVFRTMASAVLSFSVTLGFACYNGFWGARLSSVWHGSICVYYILLVLIRGMILLTEKNNRAKSEGEKARHRRRMRMFTSGLLLLLNAALILPISLMVVMKKPVNMGRIPAIATATYTTYKITMACIHIRKQKRAGQGNALMAELRTIHFIDALVSVLTLQNTLIMVERAEGDVKDMFALSAIASAALYFVMLFTTVRLLAEAVRRHIPPENTAATFEKERKM